MSVECLREKQELYIEQEVMAVAKGKEENVEVVQCRKPTECL